ncbi:MAG: phage terminase large subunit [Proteobacteria bacterium]|nr:phage terminase large subunit [Pseudomonadota bacterium]
MSKPPRHAGTTTIQLGMAYLALYSPALRNAYCSSGAEYAVLRTNEIKTWALEAGVRGIEGPQNMWRTPQRGLMRAVGVDGQYVGIGTTGVQVIDDPYPTPSKALSAGYRESVWQWYWGAARNRREPGSSAIVCHTRWHEDDLIGRLQREEPDQWEVINLPAISNFNEAAATRYLQQRAGQTFVDGWEPKLEEIGEALWPEYFPLEELLPFMGQRYFWWALYMGQPRPEGERLFDEPARFDLGEMRTADGRLTLTGWRACIACDSAATAKTKADHSAIGIVALRGYGAATLGRALHVERHQIPIPKLARRLKSLQETYRLLVVIEAVAGFKAVPQILRENAPGIRIHEVTPSADKFVRAQAVSGAWNTGRFQVPTQAPWVEPYVSEMQAFTGSNDTRDDQVDMTAHGWNALYREAPPRQRGARTVAVPAVG